MKTKVKPNIIITGGPCSGKTTLINSLQENGYSCFPEAARRVIQEEMAINGSNLPWVDNYGFSAKALSKMLDDLAQASSDDFVFFDRGIPDLIGYMNFYGNEVPSMYYEQIELADYSKQVIFLNSSHKIYKQDEERIESYEEAQRISECLFETYSTLGFSVFELKLTSIVDRVRIIENELLSRL